MASLLRQHIIPHRATLRQALGRINALSGHAVMALVVVGEGSHRVVGTVTDGDLRRALVGGLPLEAPVEKAMNRNFYSVRSPYDVEGVRRGRQRGHALLPVVDAEGNLTDLLDLQATPCRLPLSAIIMAGGKGERLRPLTLDRPKPLIPVGGRPIIDYAVEQLARAGITDVTVTVNYLAQQLEEYFSAPRHGLTVQTLREPSPLGTIGAAALRKGRDPRGATLVTNSDIYTTLSLEDMYCHHSSTGSDVTIATLPYNVSVPYAIVESDGHWVKALTEKPTYSYMANGGIYIFSNRVLEMIEAGARTDAPDLVARAIEAGARVSLFPINGTWIDIGNLQDLAHARELLGNTTPHNT